MSWDLTQLDRFMGHEQVDPFVSFMKTIPRSHFTLLWDTELSLAEPSLALQDITTTMGGCGDRQFSYIV